MTASASAHQGRAINHSVPIRVRVLRKVALASSVPYTGTPEFLFIIPNLRQVAESDYLKVARFTGSRITSTVQLTGFFVNLVNTFAPTLLELPRLIRLGRTCPADNPENDYVA